MVLGIMEAMLKNGSLKILILFYTRRQTAQNPHALFFARKDFAIAGNLDDFPDCLRQALSLAKLEVDLRPESALSFAACERYGNFR